MSAIAADIATWAGHPLPDGCRGQTIMRDATEVTTPSKSESLSAVFLFLLALGGCSGGGGQPPTVTPGGPGDRDGDGLADGFEIDGWEIAVDAAGIGGEGGQARVLVTSDPDLADTDGDGLQDGEEFQARSNPRAADTDGDGLDDLAEWRQWKTSPASADTDGDARGPNGSLAPRAELFDGNEVLLLGTSPTLADTDGDNRTDYEEYTSSGSNPLVGDVPRFEMEFAGDLDVRLDVEYAESLGQSTEYGTTFSTSRTSTTSSSSSHTHSVSAEMSLTVGISVGIPECGAKSEFTASLGYGYEANVTSTNEDSVSAQQEHSRFVGESRDGTEVASTGRISTGIILRNVGDSTFTIDGLSTALLYAPPRLGNRFQTMATMSMPAGTVTLARRK